jgi:hypothetical protein
MPTALQEVLAPEYLADLPQRSLEDLRARRAACQEVETGLSLLRRLVQGRLDIVGAEVARRAEGAAPGDLADLVARLPEVLADRTQSPGPGRLSAMLVPETLDAELEAELHEVGGEGSAVDPSSLDDAGLRDLAEALTGLERKVSAHRQAVFGALDALDGELARRYRAGDASVDSLLT